VYFYHDNKLIFHHFTTLSLCSTYLSSPTKAFLFQQGKFSAPIHWNSYTLNNENALQAVRGIRTSDATAFCDWLNNQQWLKAPPISSNLFYRLPTISDNIDGIKSDSKQNWEQTFENIFNTQLQRSVDLIRRLSADFFNRYENHLSLDKPIENIILLSDHQYESLRLNKANIYQYAQKLYRDCCNLPLNIQSIFRTLSANINTGITRMDNDININEILPYFLSVILIWNTLYSIDRNDNRLNTRDELLTILVLYILKQNYKEEQNAVLKLMIERNNYRST
jgi:hypothetical protein